MIKDIPNILSWSRAVLAPVVVGLHLTPGYGPAFAVLVFVLAAITDYADGKLARGLRQSSPFGMFLDPVTDKILVIAVLLVLVAVDDPVAHRGLLVTLAALVILREVVQSALRDWMAQVGRVASVRVTSLSKAKTVMQVVALTVLLSGRGFAALGMPQSWVGPLGTLLLALAALLGLVTLAQFLRVAVTADKEG